MSSLNKLKPKFKQAEQITLFASVALYFCFPILAVMKLKLTAIFNFFAADTFYYLSIAKISPALWNSTDGQTHTNGFHPLWQNLLNTVYSLFKPSQAVFIYTVFFVSLFLTFGGFYFMSNASQRITKSRISWLFMFPGAVYLCGFQATTVEYGISNIYQPLSFVNGMESPLTIFFFGVLIYYLSRCNCRSQVNWFVLGCIIAIVTLSRLDDVFLYLGFVVYIAIFARDRFAKNLLALTIPVAFSILMLFAYHSLTQQTLMPVSGLIKGTNTGEFPSNFETLRNVLFPNEVLQAVTTRVYGLLIPFFLAIVALVILVISNQAKGETNRSGSESVRNLRLFIVPLSTYVLLKSSYTFIRFFFIETGYWYYVGPVVAINFIIALLIGSLFDKNIFSRVLILSVLSLLQVFNLSHTYQRLQSQNLMLNIFVNRDRLSHELESRFGKNAKIVDGTDGIYSFIFDSPSQSGRGFTINKDGYIAFQKNGYVGYYEYLMENGYTVLVGLDVYTHPVPKNVQLEQVYRDSQTGTVFWKLIEATDSSNDS